MDNSKSVNALLGKYKDPVLIVEDKMENQLLLKGLCKKLNIEADCAENGKVALEMLKKREYALFIVDMMMPVMDGKTFISELKKLRSNGVVIVQTALDASHTIIDVMKMGVYDYIIKPIDPELFQQSLLKALEYKYLRDVELQQSLMAGEKIRAQIDWLNYKENRRITDRDTTEAKSIYNVKTSLAQGAGFGTLITLIDLLQSASTIEDGKYIVEKDVVDMLITNNDYCRAQLEGLNFATRIMERDFEMAQGSSTELISRLPKILDRLNPFLEEKNLRLTYPEVHDEGQICYNASAIELVIEEMAVNAYKYAEQGSTINIICHVNEGYFWLSVKNDVKEKPFGGIGKENEKLVLEPFFRIHPPDESATKVEKIGFGLGLSVADYVSKKHGGIFIIHDVMDMTRREPKSCVLAELLLPIV